MRTRLVPTLSGLLIAFSAVAVAAAPGAETATGPETVGAALKDGPVYVDPRVTGQLSAAEADGLEKKIKDADKPLFVAVLPATSEFRSNSVGPNVLDDVRAQTGLAGVYAIRLGSGFDAKADASALPPGTVRNLTGAVKAGGPVDASTELNNFVDQALPQIRGHAPGSWGSTGSEESGVPAGLIALGGVLVVGGGTVYTVARRNRRLRAERDQAALDKLRVVVDEDITAFGEELDRLDFHPSEPGADDAMRTDYEHALDAYEQAKSLMGAARRPEDVRGVTEALEDGRFSLAALDARRRGAAPPERRSPCFFDPRHGPSVADAEWAPPGGVPRTVPVCAADAGRLEQGGEPMARTVPAEGGGTRPYWDAGPVYGPWAGGYFGGGLLPGLLVGTWLGSALAAPGYGGDWGGGDPSGYDGGGFGGDGGGGGDFGGGGGFDGGGGF
jgi:hypothetical protein